MLHVFPDAEHLSRAAAQGWVDASREAVAARGAFHVALAGGSTPRRLYTLLAGPPYAGQVNWARVHVWFGDERAVPPDHPESNYRMAREALLEHVPIPPDQVHPLEAWREPPEAAAADYAERLRARVPTDHNGMPRLDLVLLGMGEDGHTASLFPGTDIMREQARPVAAVHVPRLHAWRLSLTLPALNAARRRLILVSGPGKAHMLRRVLTQPAAEPELPVQMLARQGLDWFVDAAAAAELPEALRGPNPGG